MTDSPTVRSAAPASTRLSPSAPFPADLMALPLTELQVLHSRIGRQLEREYLHDPRGPHPVTLERHRELTVELDARERNIPPGAVR